jgi:MiaB/RimO family radical SAM methylthiotransferase
LAELLCALCNVEGNFKIRVGMMTPNMVLDILEDLTQAFKNNKVFKFVHLPVQSGDNRILKSMRRFYSVADFKRIVSTFREKFPALTLATDIICGFPGEDKEAFRKTLQLIRDFKPDIVNVSKFFARPGTAAAEMPNSISPLEIKRRSSIAAELARAIALERNQRWMGWSGEILVDEVGKFSGSWVGRNFAYKPIIVKSADNLLGKIVKVKVAKVFSTYLEAEKVG